MIITPLPGSGSSPEYFCQLCLPPHKTFIFLTVLSDTSSAATLPVAKAAGTIKSLQIVISHLTGQSLQKVRSKLLRLTQRNRTFLHGGYPACSNSIRFRVRQRQR